MRRQKRKMILVSHGLPLTGIGSIFLGYFSVAYTFLLLVSQQEQLDEMHDWQETEEEKEMRFCSQNIPRRRGRD